MKVSAETFVDRPRVVHLTTSHRADDPRIFERECVSLAATGRYDVFVAGFGRIPDGAGVGLIPLAAPPRKRLRRFLTGPRRASALTRSVVADIWHFHDPELLPLAAWLARVGRKVIWDAHEDYVSQFGEGGAKGWVPGPLRGLAQGGLGAFLRTIDRHAAGVVAATPVVAARYSNPRTVVVGNETRLEHFRGCQPDIGSRQLLFTGLPGPGHLFREVVRAVRDLPEVRLAVAGVEPDGETWSAAKAELGDRLLHLGWLDRQRLAAAMSASALGLLTYADTPSYESASPTKSFEFAAAGLPMVATPNAMNVRSVGRAGAGFVASGFDSASLKAAIYEGLTNRAAWESVSRAGRSWAASEGSWVASEERLLALYAEVLALESTSSASQSTTAG